MENISKKHIPKMCKKTKIYKKNKTLKTKKTKTKKKQKQKKKKAKRQETKKILKIQKTKYNAMGAEFNETGPRESEYVETKTQFNVDEHPGIEINGNYFFFFFCFFCFFCFFMLYFCVVLMF